MTIGMQLHDDTGTAYAEAERQSREHNERLARSAKSREFQERLAEAFVAALEDRFDAWGIPFVEAVPTYAEHSVARMAYQRGWTYDTDPPECVLSTIYRFKPPGWTASMTTSAEEACLKHAEHWFTCEEGPAAECDDGGKQYVVLMSGGLRVAETKVCENGTETQTLFHIPALYKTEQLAVSAWQLALQRLVDDDKEAAGSRKPRLVWRVRPELMKVIRHLDATAVLSREGAPVFLPETWYTIYSRLSLHGARDAAA